MRPGGRPRFDDERGQAVQIGAVLLLAVLVLLMSFYQASVVPSETGKIEFKDYQRATGDVAQLRDAVVRAGAEDTAVGTSVRTGSQYPARVLFVNPPPATGRLRTTDEGTVRLSNVVATDGERTNVRRFWNGDDREFADRDVVFDPDYNEFDAAPIRISQGYAYRAYDSPISETPQTLVRGNRISLVTVAGDLNTGGYASSLTVDPLSAHTRTVTVTGEGDDPVTITLDTALSAAAWERALADQYDSPDAPDHPDRYVSDVSEGPGDSVTITLEGDKSYELRRGRVELRRSGDDSAEPSPPARYVTHVGDSVVKDGEDSRAKLIVEALDRFNNPRSDARVTFNVTHGRLESADGTVLGTDAATVRTGEDGRAVVWYNASAGVYSVDAYLGDSVDKSLPPEQRLLFKVVSSDPGGGDGTQGEGSTFILLDGTDTSERDHDRMTLDLNNTGSGSLNLTGVQLAHITDIQGDAANGSNEITKLWLNGEARTVTATENLRAKFFESDPLVLTSGPNELTLEFNEGYDKQVMLRFHLFFEGGVTAVFDLVVFG